MPAMVAAKIANMCHKAGVKSFGRQDYQKEQAQRSARTNE